MSVEKINPVKQLEELTEKLEKENQILREELEKKRNERKLEERIQDLQKEKEDMEYEIENGISREEKYRQLEAVERIIPGYPIRPRKVWL